MHDFFFLFMMHIAQLGVPAAHPHTCRTQVEAGSKTVMSIGPALKSVFDSLTGHLKLL